MATNDNKITTTICTVGTLRGRVAASVLMMIACYVIAAAVMYSCTAGMHNTHCFIFIFHVIVCDAIAGFFFSWVEKTRRKIETPVFL